MNAELCCNECRVGISISLLSFSLEDAAALSCPCPESLSVLCQRLDSGSATSAWSPGMGRARRAAAQPLAQSPEPGSWRRAAAKLSLSSPWHAVGDAVPRVHAPGDAGALLSAGLCFCAVKLPAPPDAQCSVLAPSCRVCVVCVLVACSWPRARERKQELQHRACKPGCEC